MQQWINFVLLLLVSSVATTAELVALPGPNDEYTTIALLDGRVLAVGGATGSGALYAPSTGLWSVTGSLINRRSESSAARLPSGHVLVAGGLGDDNVALASCECYDPSTGTWFSTGGMTQARYGFILSVLPNGKVLAAGGNTDVYSWNVLDTCEIYDPDTRTWSATGRMNTPRLRHFAAQLPSGGALAWGGYSSSISGTLLSSEIYNHVTGQWSTSGDLLAGRESTTASTTTLADGAILAAGGFQVRQVEVYSPSTGTWSVGGQLNVARMRPSLTTLVNGRVLVAGGSPNFAATESCELFDVSRGACTSISGMRTPRSGHGAVRLQDGSVILVGGDGIPTSEVYRMQAGRWDVTASMATGRRFGGILLLPTGDVMACGGQDSGLQPMGSCELFAPTTGLWRTMSAMLFPRTWHSATMLANGKVLVSGGGTGAGGGFPTSSCELYDPQLGNWSSTGSLLTARANHMAIRLSTGAVLVIGGHAGQEPAALTTCELYDPESETWSTTGSLSRSRAGGAAISLVSGKVLLAGGFNDSDGYLRSCEIYDPGTGAWSAAASLVDSRARHTMTLLHDGRAVVSGGANNVDGCLQACEIYDPIGNQWTRSGSLAIARNQHSASLLPSGKILVVGGSASDGGSTPCLSDAEIFDPDTGSWHNAAQLASPRYGHAAAILASGDILIVGGSDNSAGAFRRDGELFSVVEGASAPTVGLQEGRQSHTATTLADGDVLVAGGGGLGHPLVCERYSPGTATWSATGALSTYRVQHSATLLRTGDVLVAGGVDTTGQLARCERYESASGTWSSAGSMSTARQAHTANMLQDGRVLVAGGYSSGWPIASCEVYSPSNNVWSSTSQLHVARSRHTATLLRSGAILVTGGATGYYGTAEASCELYDPASGSWSSTGGMQSPRIGHTATLLPSGAVLVAGGADAATSEVYDPESGTWSLAGNLGDNRRDHTATLLPGGHVLVTGGWNGGYMTSCELYDPATRQWREAVPLTTHRTMHTASLLADGQVLCVGGGLNAADLVSCERYAPQGSVDGTQPTITHGPTAVYAFESLELLGARFLASSEGGSGTSNASGANAPLVEITSAVNGDQRLIAYEQATASRLSTASMHGLPAGLAWVRIISNGVASEAWPISIMQLSQTLTFDAIPRSVYGDAPLAITGLIPGASGNPVAFTSSNHAAARIAAQIVSVVGAGTSQITATQQGNADYTSATCVRTLVIDKAQMTVVADAASRDFGEENQSFTGSLTGVVAGDDISATFASAATRFTQPGTYPAGSTYAINGVIADPDGRLGNYQVTRTAGTLFIRQSPAFSIVIKTDNPGTSNDNQFTLPLSPYWPYNCTVEWGDGTTDRVLTSNSPTHTYESPGIYLVRISENSVRGFPAIYFNNGGDRLKLLELANWGLGTWASMDTAFRGCSNLMITATDEATAKTGGVVDFSQAWWGCSAMTRFPRLDTSSGWLFTYAWMDCTGLTSFPMLETSTVVNFGAAWSGCSGLTSFPQLDTSAGWNFNGAWTGCSGLSSFPLLDTSSGYLFGATWMGCTGLTSFPPLNTSRGTDFFAAWCSCTGLTSFPLLDTGAGTDFRVTWGGCTSLTTFPMLDTSAGASFSQAWEHCSGLTSFPLLDTSSGTDFSWAWRGCRGLRDFPAINTSAGTTFSYAWYDCSGLEDFPNLDTAAGIEFEHAWRDCRSLIRFPLLDVANGTDFSHAWQGCSNLAFVPRLNFGHMTNGDGCFDGVTLATGCYSDLLSDLEAGNPHEDVVFSGGNSRFSPAAWIPRNVLTGSRRWIITDGGQEGDGQLIVFDPIGANLIYGGPSVTLHALATSGLPIAFSVISGPAHLSGSTLVFSGPGRVVVAADQSGNEVFAPAPQVQQTIMIIDPLHSDIDDESHGNAGGGNRCGVGAGIAAMILTMVFWSFRTGGRGRISELKGIWLCLLPMLSLVSNPCHANEIAEEDNPAFVGISSGFEPSWPISANDIRVGYVGVQGRSRRRVDGIEDESQGQFKESGMLLGVLHQVDDGPLAVSVDVVFARASVGNSNGSTAKQSTVLVLLGVGPSWRFLSSATDCVDVGVSMLAGGGYASYLNDYTSNENGVGGRTEVDAGGLAAQAGAEINCRWRRMNGWNECLAIGVIRRYSWLEGTSSTDWNNGPRVSQDYGSSDTMTGIFVSFSLSCTL